MGTYFGSGGTHNYDPMAAADAAYSGHTTPGNPGGGHPTPGNPGGGHPTPGNPGGGHPTTPAENAKLHPSGFSDDGMGTNYKEFGPMTGFQGGRGSEGRPLQGGESVVRGNIGTERHETLQKGHQPTEREIWAAGAKMPPRPGRGLSDSYKRDAAVRAAAQGSEPDRYVGTVTDNRTGVTAQTEYNANSGEPMGGTLSNLATAGAERNRRIAAAKSQLPSTDQNKIGPSTPSIVPSNQKPRQ